MRRDLFLLGWKTTEINKPPHRTTLARWKKCGKMKAIDGCEVEGWRSCQHGKWSWERVMKMVKQ